MIRKIVIYLLLFVIGLVLLFFAMGLFNSSVQYGHEISVDKPIKEAWAVAMDESKYDLWLEGFKSMELISGEYGEVGSKYKIIVNPGEDQEDFEMIETVVSKEPLEHVKMDFDSEFMIFKQTMTFEENDARTSIKTDSRVIGKSLFMRSMFACMETLTGSFTKQETKNIEALKRVIEENSKDYYPEPLNEVDSLELI